MERLIEKTYRYYIRGYIKAYWDIVIERGEGSYLFTVDGKKYLDYSLGGGPMILGHCHPAIVKAVHEQVDKGSQYYVINQPAVDLAEEVVKAAPCADKIRYTCSGSESVIYCLRMARAFTGKDKILRFEGSYNGLADEMTTSNMDADSTQLKDYPKPTFDSDGLPKAIEKTILIAPYNNIEIVKKIVDENEDDLAGIIVEPIQRLIVPKPNFLSDLRKLASKKGIVLIFDEVVTGFRFAYGGAQELYGVIPDIAAYGKAISGGYPMGIVGGKDEIMTLDSEETGFRVKFDGTFYGYPTACIAGLATIRELKKPRTYEELRRYGAKLRDTLRKIFAENNLTAQVLGEGPMSGYVFTDRSVVDFRSYSTGDKVLHDRLTRELLKNNLIIDMPKMYNATTHGDEELELTSEVFDRSVRSVLKEMG